MTSKQQREQHHETEQKGRASLQTGGRTGGSLPPGNQEERAQSRPSGRGLDLWPDVRGHGDADGEPGAEIHAHDRTDGLDLHGGGDAGGAGHELHGQALTESHRLRPLVLIYLSLSIGKVREIVETRLLEMGASEESIGNFINQQAKEWGPRIVGTQLGLAIAAFLIRRLIPDANGMALMLAPAGAALVGLAMASAMRYVAALR